MAGWSQTWTFFEGEWREGNTPIMGARSHGAWLASTVFDGARIFEGVAPDLDLHCARVNRSAKALGLNPTMTTEAIIARQGRRRQVRRGQAALRQARCTGVRPRAARPSCRIPTDRLRALPVRGADAGARRPVGDGDPLPPADDRVDADRRQGGLPLSEQRPGAARRQEPRFDNALVCDALGNVAETATSNVFMAKDGVVKTPIPNGTFLNGITRQRVIKLLRDDGVAVEETSLTYADFLAADEIFISGNYSKVMPVLKIDDRMLQPGPFYGRARRLYWDYAHATGGLS